MPKRKNIKFDQISEDISKEAQERIVKEFYRNMLMVQEEEKRKISRDLHDETGQIVIALGAKLNLIEKELKESNMERALKLINENRLMIQEMANKMKSIAFSLRPPGLDILGLAAVLREYFSQCTQSSPVTIEFEENIKDIKLNENIEITLYRIIQEAIYNIMKHSMAKNVNVNLIASNKKLQLVIKDSGKGFDIEKYKKEYDSTKMGLQGIKERVDMLNGTFLIESTVGKGTAINISLPLD